MVKTIIVEDELKSRLYLKEILTDHCPVIQVLTEADNIESAKEVIEKYKPQLVFMDIELNDNTSLDLLDQLSSIDFEIIFTTAYANYALKAFKFCAIDYLLKPIDVEELKLAVARAEKRIAKSSVPSYFEVMIANMKNQNISEHQIALPSLEGLTFVKVCDILYCEGDGSYTKVYLKNKKAIMTSRNLKEFETMLSDYKFCRIHNSHLINTREITHYIRGEGGQVVMTDGKSLDIARRKKDCFLQAINKI